MEPNQFFAGVNDIHRRNWQRLTGRSTRDKSPSATEEPSSISDEVEENTMPTILKTLGSRNLRKSVKLPKYEDENEWIAKNLVDFYHHVNMLYAVVTQFCSPESCPEMTATDEFEYLWQDKENHKIPTRMSAPEYIEKLLSWAQNNISDETLFPSKRGVPFPKDFPSVIRLHFRRFYRVYAHLYCHHFDMIRELGLEQHMNTSFKQFVIFIDEFKLSEGTKEYWGPLGDLVAQCLKD